MRLNALPVPASECQARLARMPERFPLPPAVARRRLVLASSSPRRRELMDRLGLRFDVEPADVDETPRSDESVDAMVQRLAAAKAVAVSVHDPEAVVIGSDTAVEMDGETFGKPGDAATARATLRRLSGRTHRVHTAVAVAVNGRVVGGDEIVSEVTFVELSVAEIDWYVATGEPLDKAGAYGMQGVGGVFVESVHGSVTGVLGLPMDVVKRLLAAV